MRLIGEADTVKSWTVTLTAVRLARVFGAVPAVPITGTLNGAMPVAHLTDTAAPVNEPLQPDGKTKLALTDHVTVLENPLIGAIVQVEVPATVARVVIPGQDGVKSWIVTGTVILLERPPLEPVMGRPKSATPVAQVMERTAPLKEPLQPVGNVKPELIAKVTLPEKPLIGLTVQVEVPA